ncbi:hypothetical protein MMPV_009692 [Pyropia vietnamensis]
MGGRPRTAGVGGLAAGAGAGGGVTKPAGVIYNCSQPGCTKTFTRRSNLRAHARIHSGLEPYVCLEPACYKRFKWKSCLNSHQRTHLRRQPVAMAACQKADKSWVVYDGSAAAAAAPSRRDRDAEEENDDDGGDLPDAFMMGHTGGGGFYTVGSMLPPMPPPGYPGLPDAPPPMMAPPRPADEGVGSGGSPINSDALSSYVPLGATRPPPLQSGGGSMSPVSTATAPPHVPGATVGSTGVASFGYVDGGGGGGGGDGGYGVVAPAGGEPLCEVPPGLGDSTGEVGDSVAPAFFVPADSWQQQQQQSTDLGADAALWQPYGRPLPPDRRPGPASTPEPVIGSVPPSGKGRPGGDGRPADDPSLSPAPSPPLVAPVPAAAMSPSTPLSPLPPLTSLPPLASGSVPPRTVRPPGNVRLRYGAPVAAPAPRHTQGMYEAFAQAADASRTEHQSEFDRAMMSGVLSTVAAQQAAAVGGGGGGGGSGGSGWGGSGDGGDVDAGACGGISDELMAQLSANPQELMTLLNTGKMPDFMTNFAESAAELSLTEHGVASPVPPTLSSPFLTSDIYSELPDVSGGQPLPDATIRQRSVRPEPPPGLFPRVKAGRVETSPVAAGAPASGGGGDRDRSVGGPVADLPDAFPTPNSSTTRGGGSSSRRGSSIMRSLSRIEEGGYSSRSPREDSFVNTLSARLATTAVVASNVAAVALVSPSDINLAGNLNPFVGRGGRGSGSISMSGSAGGGSAAGSAAGSWVGTGGGRAGLNVPSLGLSGAGLLGAGLSAGSLGSAFLGGPSGSGGSGGSGASGGGRGSIGAGRSLLGSPYIVSPLDVSSPDSWPSAVRPGGSGDSMDGLASRPGGSGLGLDWEEPQRLSGRGTPL